VRKCSQITNGVKSSQRSSRCSAYIRTSSPLGCPGRICAALVPSSDIEGTAEDDNTLNSITIHESLLISAELTAILLAELSCLDDHHDCSHESQCRCSSSLEGRREDCRVATISARRQRRYRKSNSPHHSLKGKSFQPAHTLQIHQGRTVASCCCWTRRLIVETSFVASARSRYVQRG
jgi:hypothetical protein